MPAVARLNAPHCRQAPDTQALEEAAEWLMCLSAGEVSEAEQAGLASWRASSPERERAWQRAERLLGKLGGLPPELALSALERPADPLGERRSRAWHCCWRWRLRAGWAGVSISSRGGRPITAPLLASAGN